MQVRKPKRKTDGSDKCHSAFHTVSDELTVKFGDKEHVSNITTNEKQCFYIHTKFGIDLKRHRV